VEVVTELLVVDVTEVVVLIMMVVRVANVAFSLIGPFIAMLAGFDDPV